MNQVGSKYIGCVLALAVALAGTAANALAAPPVSAESARPGYVEYEGVKVSYFEYGPSADQAPTVVATGGWPVDSRYLEAEARNLATRYHVVRYDHRGSGASDHPVRQSDYSVEKLAGEFGAVVDATAPGHRVHVFGEAWGPFIASEYAHEHPGRIASLTTLGAPSLDLAGNAVRRAAANPADYPRIAAQLAATSYIGALQIPVLPDLALQTGVPTIVANVLLDWINGDMDRLSTTDLRNDPATVADMRWGINMYRESFPEHFALFPQYDYLDIPEVQLFQLTGDALSSPLVSEGLETRTPKLIRHDLPGNHFFFDWNAVDAGVVQAITDTETNG